MLVAVVNSKGGVGKSTISVHAAVWLRDRGANIAVVDADAQASTTEWLSEAAPDIRIERCDTLDQLHERIPRLTALHDIVLADGPAGLTAETVTLAGAADLVLMPIGPSMMDVRASYRTARVIYGVRLRGARPGLPRVYTVLNRIQPRTRLAQLAVEAVRKYGFPVACSYLHQRQAYAEACGQATVVSRMGHAAQPAAREMDRLFSEVFDAKPARAVTSPRTVPLARLLSLNAPGGPHLPAAAHDSACAAATDGPGGASRDLAENAGACHSPEITRAPL